MAGNLDNSHQQDFYSAVQKKIEDLNTDQVQIEKNRNSQLNNLGVSQFYKNKYKSERHPFREWGKWLFALVTLPLAAFGVLNFWRTTRVVKPNELLVKKDFRGNYIVLPPGRHSLFPWESYVSDPVNIQSSSLKLGNDYIMRVKPGELGSVIKRGNSTIKILIPGTYLFDLNEYVIEGSKSIYKKGEVSFGGENGLSIINVEGNELAVVSDKATGKNELLEQGLYVYLESNKIIYGPQPRNHDVVRLGPVEVITARAGFAGIYYHQKDGQDAALDVIESGERKILDASKNERFLHLLNTQIRSEEINVLHAVTSDGYDFSVKANITYQIKDVKAAAQKIDNISEGNMQVDQVKKEVHQYAKSMIAQIIMKHSRRELQPFNEDKLNGSEPIEQTLSQVGLEIRETLNDTLKGWGVELHQNIDIIDLTMTDSKQRDEFRKRANQIQAVVFSNQEKQREMDGMKIQIDAARLKEEQIRIDGKNLLSQEEAKAAAYKIKAQAEAEAEAKACEIKAEAEAKANKMKVAFDAQAKASACEITAEAEAKAYAVKAEAEIKANKGREKAPIEAIKEALTEMGLNAEDMKQYLAREQFTKMTSSTSSAIVANPYSFYAAGAEGQSVDIPVSKSGVTKSGEIYRIGETHSASQNYLDIAATREQLAMTDAVKKSA